MAQEPNPSPGAGPGTLRRRGCLLWSIGILVLAAGIGGWAWWAWEQDNERSIAHEREMAKRVTYQASLFPASVNFQRGPARKHELMVAPWRGVSGEIATCPDDSEGQELAEFYQAPEAAPLLAAPFADESHPYINRRLSSAFDSDARPLFASAIILSETEADGWKLRTTLIPTPHGSKITPENLPPPLLAKLGDGSVPAPPIQGKPHVDPRHAGHGGMRGKSYSGKSREQVQHEAEARVEREYRQSRDLYDRHHHHYYFAEAVRDFGGGRIVILRRFGQVYGPTTITRAAIIIQDLARSVTMPTP